MKMLKILFVLPFLALLFVACSGDNGDADSHQKDNMEMHDVDHDGHQHATDNDAEKTGPEYTSAYVCPMHCKGSGSDKPGKCPVCEMDYVKNDN